jgi:hypothetical protein
VTAGLGGTQADVIADESSRLAPVSPATARSLIAGTRAAAGLSDDALDQVADVITRVAQLASDHPEIAELDLNPVIVGDDGRCHVVDASILLRRPAAQSARCAASTDRWCRVETVARQLLHGTTCRLIGPAATDDRGGQGLWSVSIGAVVGR